MKLGLSDSIIEHIGHNALI